MGRGSARSPQGERVERSTKWPGRFNAWLYGPAHGACGNRPGADLSPNALALGAFGRRSLRLPVSVLASGTLIAMGIVPPRVAPGKPREGRHGHHRGLGGRVRGRDAPREAASKTRHRPRQGRQRRLGAWQGARIPGTAGRLKAPRSHHDPLAAPSDSGGARGRVLSRFEADCGRGISMTTTIG